MIEIFNDRIEITDRGAPLVEINRFTDTVPKSRNEDIVSVPRRLNIYEEMGNGETICIAAVYLRVQQTMTLSL